MYALSFLNTDDIIQLKAKLAQTLMTWSVDYTYSQSISANIYPIKFEDFHDRKGNVYKVEKGIPVLVCEKNVDAQWTTLIFPEQLEYCPRDAKFNSIIKRVRDVFFQDVLKIDVKDRSNDVMKSMSIDAYLHLQIKNNDSTVMDVYAPHVFFLQYIEKKSAAPNQRLVPVESIIGHLKVPIHFSFDFGSIGFSDILKMEEGTIILSPQEIDNTFQIKIGANSVASAAMGKLTNNIAFCVKGK